MSICKGCIGDGLSRAQTDAGAVLYLLGFDPGRTLVAHPWTEDCPEALPHDAAECLLLELREILEPGPDLPPAPTPPAAWLERCREIRASYSFPDPAEGDPYAACL